MVLLASVGHHMLTFSDKRQQFKIGLSLREQRRKEHLGETWKPGVFVIFCLSEFLQGGKGGHANQQYHTDLESLLSVSETSNQWVLTLLPLTPYWLFSGRVGVRDFCDKKVHPSAAWWAAWCETIIIISPHGQQATIISHKNILHLTHPAKSTCMLHILYICK